MEYRKIGDSGLKVSVVGLGGNNFGGRANEQASLDVLSQALDRGINFIDTAAAYNDGRSEELVGKAVKGRRSEAIIATKFGNPRSVGKSELPGSRRHIVAAVEASLKRLATDYIDLYYLHYPDPETPIEETLRALDDTVKSGKVRYVACCNFAGWQLSEAAWTARACHLEPFIAMQSRYNLLDRKIEKELVPACLAHGVGIIPWGPLASGFLTGKYRQGKEAPAGARQANAAPMPIYSDVMTAANYEILDQLERFSQARGHRIGDLAISWLLAHPWLGSVIAGAMNGEQLQENVAAASWKLTAEDLGELDKII
ncbi:MAG: aldo/keto reductase [Deltaproteobacteria bacterium]|nr:aldo/keto reductase [Deltaproteobacteria bacterium]